MFDFLFPDRMYKSTYEIDFEELYLKGIRALIFDIDNTLVEHGKDADSRAIEFFKRLKGIGYLCCLLSNNKEERVKRFNKDVNINYIYKAGKPKRAGYKKAMEIMGSDISNTIFIGDQIFTDIIGAKASGITSYLVEPIDKHEELQIVLKRFLEKPIIAFYKRSNMSKRINEIK